MSAVPEAERHSAAAIGAREAEALFAPLAGEPRLLVAVSGGPDSVAMLALLSEWAKTAGRPALDAATVEHGLRSGSVAEAESVAALCGRLGVGHNILRWGGAKPASGLQDAARRARYDLLSVEARRVGGAAIVTAHTLDDQAETLLMRLAHGSGPAGLAGMRFRSRRADVDIVRPLLGIAKARLVATAEARGLSYSQDPSNADARFERVRLRSLAPLLSDHGLDAARFGVLAQRLARQEDALSALADGAFEKALLPSPVAGVTRLDLRLIGSEPDEILLRVLAQAVAATTEPAGNYARLERLEACAEAVFAALRTGLAMRRTLSGCTISLDIRGLLTIRPEGLRRRGVHPATS